MAVFNYLVVAIFAALVGSSFAQQCPPTGAAVIPHNDCTKFISCLRGRGQELDCPANLYFNPETVRCDYPSNVPDCVDGTRPPPTTTTPEPPTTSEPLPTLTNCGDTLTANAGVIRYKLNETYLKNELCTFIIRTVDFGGFTFTLHSDGIDPKTDAKAINIFTYGDNGQIDSIHMGPPNPLTTAYASGAIAVIVFKTKGNNGTGFDLEFQGVGSTAYSRGVQMVIDDGPGVLRNMTVPNWPDFKGTTNMLVFVAPNKTENPYSAIKLTLSDENLYNIGDSNTCGMDFLRIYTFDLEKTKEMGLFCDERFHKSIYDSSTLLIVMFRKFWDGDFGKVTLNWKGAPWDI